mgnify:CR=1 FL=1
MTNEGKGNSEFSNLPRKWNTAVAGSKDNFLLHNDLVFHPVINNGELGFSVWVGGILSSVLNDYAIPLNVWIKLLVIIDEWTETHLQKSFSSLKILRQSYGNQKTKYFQ